MRVPPALPSRIEALSDWLRTAREESFKLLRSRPSFRLHVACVDRCLLVLDELQAGYEPRQDADTVKVLVRRIADAAQAAFALMTEGFYQTSYAVQRDMVESGFLLELFLRKPELVVQWRGADAEKRRRQFHPKSVRDKLGSDRADRDRTYAAFCEYATHPTMEGSHLLEKGGVATAGPRLHPEHLRYCLGELTRNLSYFTVVSCQILKNDIPVLREDVDSLYGFLREWLYECLRLTMGAFDDAGLAEWARRLWPPQQPPPGSNAGHSSTLYVSGGVTRRRRE
jgi:hypothetical protein